MNQAHFNDGNLSHAMLNHLNALYRGKLAFLNALSHMKYRGLHNDEVNQTKKGIESIQRWLKDLWQGMPLLSVSWKEAETFDAKRSLELLKEIKSELLVVVEELTLILKSKDRFTNDEYIKFLLASYSRHSYARENYLNGFIEYGNLVQREDILNNYQGQAAIAAEELTTSTAMIKEYLSGKELTEGFLERLIFAVNLLPAQFRMSLHDINHLIAVFDPEFTFEMAGISDSHATEWRSLSLNAHQAGYWHAFDITPKEAKVWMEYGITDPVAAGSFKHYGFIPNEALSWLDVGLQAEVAFIWQRLGYQPEQSRPYIEKGIYLPMQPYAA